MINTVILMGRLTADPELKTTTSNISVTRFTVALDRKYQKQGEERQTDFINCTAWRGTADFVTKYFKKGDMIAIVGEIQTSNYTDKDGNKRTATDIVVSEVSFCGGKREQNATQQAANTADEFEEITDDDELPF